MFVISRPEPRPHYFKEGTMIGNNEDTKNMVLVMVLARLQAQGKHWNDVDDVEKDRLIDEAIEDLELCGPASGGA